MNLQKILIKSVLKNLFKSGLVDKIIFTFKVNEDKPGEYFHSFHIFDKEGSDIYDGGDSALTPEQSTLILKFCETQIPEKCLLFGGKIEITSAYNVDFYTIWIGPDGIFDGKKSDLNII
jgi:hypothetical protein